jgi:outer membrane protein assembly factor BamB
MRRHAWIGITVTALLLTTCSSEPSSSGGSSPSGPPALQQAWSFETGSPTSQPVVADGMVYFATQDGRVFALTTDCGVGGATCEPTWTADTGTELPLVSAVAVYGKAPVTFRAPIVTSGVVVVSGKGSDAQLFAYGLDCGTGGATCDPLWTAGAGYELAASGDMLYVTSRDGLAAIDVTSCPSDGSRCEPAWTIDGFALGAISDGVVYGGALPRAFDAETGVPLGVGRADGPADAYASTTVGEGIVVSTVGRGFEGTDPSEVFAFSVDCLRRPGVCSPLWTAQIEDQFLTIFDVAITNGRVFLGTETVAQSGEGHVIAFDVGCRDDGGACEPSLYADVPDGEVQVVAPIVSGDQVLFTSLEQGFVESYPVDAAATDPAPVYLWRSVDMYAPTQPVIADGFAFVIDDSAALYVIDLGCGTSGEVCQPVAVFKQPFGKGLNPPAIDGGYVFLGSNEGSLQVFVEPTPSVSAS